MATAALGAATAAYPATAWAGNNPTARVTGSTQGHTITITDGTITESREVDASGKCFFPLYPFIASAVNGGDICGTWAATHGTKSLTLTDTTSNDTVTINVAWVWGGLQLGEAVTERTITYNANYPMTIDTVAARYDVSQLEDGDTVDGVVVHILTDTCDKGVYLRWLNRRGETCYRLLRIISESDEAARKVLASEPVFDTADYDNGYNRGDGALVSATATHTIALGLPFQRQAQVEELVSLLTAARCDRYMGNGQWQEVRVNAGSFTPKNDTLQTFQVSITIPTIQPQQP